MSKNKTKKSLTKKWWFWVIVMIVIFAIIGSFGSSDSDKSETKEAKITDTSAIKATSATSDEAESLESTDRSENKEALKEALKDKEGLVWFGDVRNDVTGNWRLAEYASSDTLVTFAAEYYNAFFDSDKEIHAVINMSTHVTGQISKIMDDTLDVTLYEYVDGEEHDAKELFSGMLLKEYLVTISTGDIEEIQ